MRVTSRWTISTWITMPGLLLIFPLVASMMCLLTTHALDIAEVDEMLTAAHACRAHTNPGLTVSVVKEGQTLLSRGYGSTRIQGNPKVDENTLIGLASLTKAFTAALLLKVMDDDGRYNISTPLHHILGQDFRFADDFRTQEATVEDLLSHRMAIPPNNLIRFDSTLTRSNLQNRLQFLKPVASFRSRYLYNNLMYGLATHITEIIGHDTWENLMTRHILGPLGMTRTTFSKALDPGEVNFAPPVEDYYGELKYMSVQLNKVFAELGGSGSILSTANDMAKWMNFHLYRGLGDGKRVMEEKVLEETYKPRTAITPNPLPLFQQPTVPVTHSYDAYGLGWRLGYYRGYPTLGHSGSTHGYRSLLTLVPSLKVGVFTAMTGKDPEIAFRGTLHSFLLDHVLNVTSWLNVTTMCTFPAPWYSVNATKSEPVYNHSLPLAHSLSSYTGHYSNPAYGVVEVKKWTQVDSQEQSGNENFKTERLTVQYGLGVWDMFPIRPVSSKFPPGSEFFFGKGRNINNWLDYSPFVFHPPSQETAMVEYLSIPAFDSLVPPMFVRIHHTVESSGNTLSSSYFVCCIVFVIFILFLAA